MLQARNVDTPLGRRMFLVGANASGKPNFLDALHFLRDIAKTEGGGLQFVGWIKRSESTKKH